MEKDYFQTGPEDLIDATKLDRPVTVTCKTNVSKVREIIENDGRYMIRNIAKSFWRIAIAGAINFEAKISAGCIPHIY